MAQGVMVFSSLSAALSAGYAVCGRYDDGYLVRMRTQRGWVMALAAVRK